MKRLTGDYRWHSKIKKSAKKEQTKKRRNILKRNLKKGNENV